jgi:hypothetical protein
MTKNWLLHHDNTPILHFLFTREYSTKDNMTVVPHPPNSPDLAPYNLSLFPLHLDTIEVIKAESQAVPNTLTEHDIRDEFKNYQKQRELCVRPERDC